MNAEKRAIIDKFLANNELQTRHNGGVIKSVADVEKYQATRRLLRARAKAFHDLRVVYRKKTAQNVDLLMIEDVARVLIYSGGCPYRYLDEFPDDEFAQLLRVARAVCEGLLHL